MRDSEMGLFLYAEKEVVRWLQTGRSEDRQSYKCKEKIEEKIDAYFKECEGKILKDERGKPIFDKFGQPVIINQEPPIVTGLALALGVTTRLSLITYEGKKEFMNTITRVKTMIEAYTEERLFDREGSNGASSACGTTSRAGMTGSHPSWIRKSSVHGSHRLRHRQTSLPVTTGRSRIWMI